MLNLTVADSPGVQRKEGGKDYSKRFVSTFCFFTLNIYPSSVSD